VDQKWHVIGSQTLLRDRWIDVRADAAPGRLAGSTPVGRTGKRAKEAPSTRCPVTSDRERTDAAPHRRAASTPGIARPAEGRRDRKSPQPSGKRWGKVWKGTSTHAPHRGARAASSPVPVPALIWINRTQSESNVMSQTDARVAGGQRTLLQLKQGMAYAARFRAQHLLLRRRMQHHNDGPGAPLKACRRQVETNGPYFGGYVKPASMKENRRDRCLARNQTNHDRQRSRFG
jgi:hypothetical protein